MSLGMDQTPYTSPTAGINTVWLTFSSDQARGILRCQLLGLGSDHSLICGLPEPHNWDQLKPGTTCRGHTLMEGDTYQFETTVKEIQGNLPALILNRPHKITRRAPRVHPRVPVEISGTIRPMSQEGWILAVLPGTLSNLCPTGCLLQVPEATWPNMATLNVVLSCRLPGLSHTSKFQGWIEWIDPTPDLHMGIQFQFSSPSDVASQDLHRWFHSQQAKLINTVA